MIETVDGGETRIPLLEEMTTPNRSIRVAARGNREMIPGAAGERLARSRPIAVARRRSLLMSIVMLALLSVPPAAGAHLRSGTVAVDYRASVSHPANSAYTARIFQSDRALGLAVKDGHAVVLVGYLGEPVFRLDGAGLWVNAASPTAVVLRLASGHDRVVAAAPRWRLQRGRRSVVWHDARAQGLGPGVSHGTWNVPLIVDGRRSRLGGDLWRFPAPSPWTWLVVLAVVLGAGLAPMVLRHGHWRRPAAAGCAWAAAAASVVLLMAFALDAYASPGTWIEALDATAFLGVGVWVLLRGPAQWRVAGAIWIGLVGLAVGLLEGAIFLHPIVLAILPATAMRLAGIVAIGAGLDAAAIGGLVYAEAGGVMPGERPESGRPAPLA